MNRRAWAFHREFVARHGDPALFVLEILRDPGPSHRRDHGGFCPYRAGLQDSRLHPDLRSADSPGRPALGDRKPARAGAKKIATTSTIGRRCFGRRLAPLPEWRIESAGAYFAYLTHPFASASAQQVAEKLATERGVLVLAGQLFRARTGAPAARRLRQCERGCAGGTDGAAPQLFRLASASTSRSVHLPRRHPWRRWGRTGTLTRNRRRIPAPRITF